MKSYFPFTDYDFWAYLASGFLLTVSPLPSGRLADGAVGRRGCEHGLLDQAGEAMADALGGAAVEAEDVLVQVPSQVLRADGAVMGAEQPAFGEGEHEVD